MSTKVVPVFDYASKEMAVNDITSLYLSTWKAVIILFPITK